MATGLYASLWAHLAQEAAQHKAKHDVVVIKVPDIGDFDEVMVIEVLVKPGDRVRVGQSLITVESDKASMEIPSSHAGVVKEIKTWLGDRVKQGSVVLMLEASVAPAAAPATFAINAPDKRRQKLLRGDWTMARLPELSPDRLSDPDKGLWEFFGKDPAWLLANEIAARDPRKDVQPGVVAIDFGTSSTVVALAQHGRPVVLRVGAHNLSAHPTERDYENPTVLELVNLGKVIKSWQQYAYRPQVQWDDLRCSHEAQQSLRNNQADLKRVASILTRLKHWALRDAKAQPWRVTDQAQQAPWLLMPLKANNPSSHSPLEVDADYELDPVELYAYFLGLAINWRERGIFERYVLTFPVAYPQAVKDCLLASFRRGLQRSWPHTLVAQPGALARFSVSEVATEPLAYAAAALPTLGLYPEGAGLAYAVFDFGGGTTDFDFGLWREPTEQEQNEGRAEVIHSFGASGDRLLGGENLLELLAYEALVQNAQICREKSLVMYPPLGVVPAPGLEAVLDQGLAARTNMQVLMGRLRDFWEQDGHCTAVDAGAVTVSLLNRQGQPVSVTLALDGDALAHTLVQRIGRGIEQFMLAAYFSDRGRLFQADRGRQIGVAVAALGKRAGTGVNVS